jgi:glucosylceramidase
MFTLPRALSAARLRLTLLLASLALLVPAPGALADNLAPPPEPAKNQASDANPPAASPIGNLTRYLTARDSDYRLSSVPANATLSTTKDVAGVTLDPKVRYQTITGFGGAFTEASAYVLSKMPADKSDEVMRAYFDPVKGLGYTLCRTHINSCDFSLGNYAYDETAGDYDLKDFSIAHDEKLLIPMIKRAQEISHNGFKLFASPWSPPAWMKTNGQMDNGGKLKPDCRDAWANYYVRYIQAYEKDGIPIWGLTVQNEPAATQTWDSCVYTADEERDFVRDHLGPTIEKSGLGTHIMVWDHNRDIMFDRARTVLDDPAAAKYVWGVAFHWYVADLFDNVQRVHDAYPDKNLLLTEGCQESGTHLHEWAVGERYGHAMVEDLNHWSVGWVDWNMVLDQTGGPNHVGNFTSAPIIANTDTGTLTYNPSYYYLGQFAKFVRPGAVRILAAPTSDSLETTAFLNTDGSIVVVVMNRTELPVRFALRLGDHATEMDSPERSIQTIVIKS